MLGLAKRVGARFLLTSTSEVYGDPLQHPQVETYWGNVNPIGTTPSSPSLFLLLLPHFETTIKRTLAEETQHVSRRNTERESSFLRSGQSSFHLKRRLWVL